MTRIQVDLVETNMVETKEELETETTIEMEEMKEIGTAETEIDTTTGIRIEMKEVAEIETTTETAEIGITIETVEILIEAKEEEKEGMKLPETEETNTIAEAGKQVITLIGTELKDSAQSFFRTLGGSLTEGVRKLAPSINESLENLKESIPEIKGTVDAVSSMPAIAKLLQTKEKDKNKEETQNEL